MRWNPANLALVTSAAVVATVATGVGYVVRVDPALTAGTGHGVSAYAIDDLRIVNPAVAGPLDAFSTAPTPHLTASAVPPVRPVTPSADLPAPSPTAVSPSIRPTPSATATPRVGDSAPRRSVQFSISSFNVLGSSHTSGRGKRPGMASGRARTAGVVALIRRHDLDVVGFQELQGDQLATLQARTGWRFYPGFSKKPRDTENSLGWDPRVWVAVEQRTLDIPYFNGNDRAMPYVRLRHLASGVQAWFANFHNPADTRRFHRQQRFRDRATSVEASLANRLLRQTDLPVFITGDMNERDEYFCQLTSKAPMVAARGGTNIAGCRPGNPRAVDWIFGSQGVTFTGYVEDRSALVRRTTDHPVIVARARIVGETSFDD